MDSPLDPHIVKLFGEESAATKDINMLKQGGSPCIRLRGYIVACKLCPKGLQ